MSFVWISLFLDSDSDSSTTIFLYFSCVGSFFGLGSSSGYSTFNSLGILNGLLF